MGMLSTVKHEVKEVGLVTLYFFSCFGVILTLKKLMLKPIILSSMPSQRRWSARLSSQRLWSCWVKPERAPGLTLIIQLVRQPCIGQ